jgi:hypothetical protein
MRQPDTSGHPKRCAAAIFSLHVVCSWRDDMQPPLVFSRDEAHIAKMLNNTVNNPIVLVLALAVVVLAFGVYLVAF